MTELMNAITDPELGAVTFQVDRTIYRRTHGELIPVRRTTTATGCIHPGPPELMQLMPEETRAERFIVIYTSLPLSAGVNEAGTTFQAADQVHYGERVWRVVRVRDWMQFGYVQALAVLVPQDADE